MNGLWHENIIIEVRMTIVTKSGVSLFLACAAGREHHRELKPNNRPAPRESQRSYFLESEVASLFALTVGRQAKGDIAFSWTILRRQHLGPQSPKPHMKQRRGRTSQLPLQAENWRVNGS